MRIVVAGASGFIGQALLEELSTLKDLELIAVSRNSIHSKRFNYVGDYEQTPSADVLLYCAEPSLISSYTETRRLENIKRATKVLRKGFKKAIYLSSAAVYGDKLLGQKHFSESSPALNVSEYARSKKEVENLFLDHQGIVFRLSNVFGPSCKEESVFFSIYSQLLTQASKMYLKNKTSERDYIWITDVVQCLANAVLNRGSAGVYNLGSGNTISVDDLVARFCQQMNRQKPEIIETSPLDYHSCLSLDIHRTSLMFNWSPKVEITEGIKQILRNNYS